MYPVSILHAVGVHALYAPQVISRFNPFASRILSLDLSDADVCGSATEKALQLFGRVDILINNAGMSVCVCE